VVEGTSYGSTDYYAYNIGPARAAGLIAGGYHFLVGTEDGKAQADYFLSIAKPQKGDLLPMLDLEQTNGVSSSEVADAALAWLEVVGAAVGQKLFVYTTASLFSEIGNPEDLKTILCGLPNMGSLLQDCRPVSIFILTVLRFAVLGPIARGA